MTDITSAVSPTVRVSGPTCSIDSQLENPGKRSSRSGVKRYAAHRRLKADNAAERCGDPDRSSAVAAKGDWRQPRRNRCRRTGAAAARGPVERPRVAGCRKHRIVSDCPITEFGDVGLSNDDRVRGRQAFDHHVILIRQEIGVRAGAADSPDALVALKSLIATGSPARGPTIRFAREVRFDLFCRNAR